MVSMLEIGETLTHTDMLAAVKEFLQTDTMRYRGAVLSGLSTGFCADEIRL
jgi:hypothetical protein